MMPLLAGLDTVECAYYLRPTPHCTLNFGQIAIEKEVLRQGKKREPRKIEIGGIEFFLQPYGTGSGYPFLIENEDMSIEFGEFNDPSVIPPLLAACMAETMRPWPAAVSGG